MRVLRHPGAAAVLASLVLCSGSVWGQQVFDPAYPTTMNQTPTGPMVAYSATYQPVVTSEADLAGRVADLEAALAKIAAKEAEAEKKAASGMSAKVFGRMYWDWTTYDQDAGSVAIPGYGNQENGVEPRTARIGIQGSGFHVFDYKIEMDFASRDRTAFKDTYMQVNELPWVGHARVGFFKEPFDLEELTSSKYITFTERNIANLAFSPARRIGVMAFDQCANERFLWQAGVFSTNADAVDTEHDIPPYFEDDRGGSAFTMRLVGLPWYDEATDGRGLLHTGVAYSYREVADTAHRFRVRPEDHLGDRILDTTIAGIDAYDMLNLQAAWVYGPLSIQSEYYTVSTKAIGTGPSRTLDGGYIFVSYFLTGENRAYKRSEGCFDRVKPFENFFRVRTEDGSVQCGRGAWEVAYRFSTVDFSGAAVGAGNVDNHTFGVNWYLTPYMRLMADLIHSDAFRDGQRGSENIFVTRAQIDW